MSNRRRVLVVGGSGFVGSAVIAALTRRQAETFAFPAPRLRSESPLDGKALLGAHQGLVGELATLFCTFDSVVNAAGIARAESGEQEALWGANSILPGVLAAAARQARVPRFIHISSAAVQGRKRVLDASKEIAPFSAYSRSKCQGEALADELGPDSTVIFRPAGVHGKDRDVTQLTRRVARSPLASVAAPGTANTPQALVENVGDAVAFLATSDMNPPRRVHHPSEGLTTGEFLKLLGSREPLRIPNRTAKIALRMLNLGAPSKSSVEANLRRLEMLWFGQQQAPSWLTSAGWEPPADRSIWAELARE